MSAEFESELEVEAEPEGVADYFDIYANQMRFFVDLLVHEGVEYGLIGPRETNRIWSRHILNCMALAQFLPEDARVADIGSGAGLPGIVLAVARPDLSLTLIETMAKRCEWLEEASEQLGLDNVTVLHKRAEDLKGKQKFPFITARAVGNLSTLLKWTAPLLRSGGQMVFLKGESVQTEIQQAKDDYLFRKLDLALPTVHEVETPLTGEITRVVIIGTR